MEMHQILFVIFFISSPLAISAWDIAVAVDNEIQFLNNSGEVIAHVSESMVKLQALTYSPEQQLLFYSDNSLTNGSIFSFQVLTDSTDMFTHANLKAIVSEQIDTVQNIVYDHKTQILYWTNGYGHQIKWLKLSSTTPEPGQILYNFTSKVPFGIAIDSCKRYLYWTNCQRSGATIERSLLDGSKLEVLVNDNLDQPLGIVLDQNTQRMFWIDDVKGNSYKIESATFTGQDRRTIIHGSHHQPFSLAVSRGYVYWTDRTNTAVWKLPIDADSKLEPIKVLDMDKITPTGITSASQILSNDLNLECSRVVEPTMKVIKATVETVSAATVEETNKLNINVSSYCLNQGLLKDSATNCDCPSRFSGPRCEIDNCHNYCLNGICEVDSAGQPRCRKCAEGWSGDQCQINVCHNYCVRGSCIVENSVEPKCECNEGWSGERCEIWHFEKQKLEKDMLEVCKSYCRLYTSNEQQQNLQPLEHCRCSSDITDSASNSSLPNDIIAIGELRQACMWKELNETLLLALGLICIALLVLVAVLTRKVFSLRKRPRIKRRIIVSKSVTPLTSRPQPTEQCEITIENCCNMNICETPCFEPEFRTPHATLTKSGKKEENRTLLGNMELPPDDLY